CLSGLTLPHCIALSGARLDGARRAARQLVDGGATHLLSFGLAGGLDPALPPGTLLLARKLLRRSGDAILVAAAWLERAASLFARLMPATKPMFGTDVAIATATAKA